MTEQPLVFDTGPLSHFAKEGWLGILKAIAGPRSVLIPDVVAEEIQVGAAFDERLRQVLAQPWISKRELVSDDEIGFFAHFSALLVHKDRNRGDAGVLALSKSINGIAVLDDRVARRAAESAGVDVTGTLSLLCEAIRSGLLTVRLVSTLADDLLHGDYRLPFKPGGFEKWAGDNGLVSPSE
jgi:predicted nucleic acid-binding protein